MEGEALKSSEQDFSVDHMADHGSDNFEQDFTLGLIESERQFLREIQEALIRENYLEGSPSGVWDQRTKAAMIKYQDDHGWQTKVLPDSRALIALGLGPKHDNLLNPESVDPAPAAAPATTRATAKPLESARNQR